MRVLKFLEFLLGSSVVGLLCFAALASRLLVVAGFGWFEYLLAIILYANFSTKIEQIHAAQVGRNAKRQDNEDWLGPKDEHAVGVADAPKPSPHTLTGAPTNG
jgi:hypothetical protein